MKELAIQKEICDAAEELNPKNLAYKQNNRFMTGVADLFVKMVQYPVTIIEVKIVSPLDGRGPVVVDITPHQLKYLRWMQEAGVVAGWVAVSKCYVKNAKLIYVSTKLNSDPIDVQHLHTTNQRSRGCLYHLDLSTPHLFAKMPREPWPVERIVLSLRDQFLGRGV